MTLQTDTPQPLYFYEDITFRWVEFMLPISIAVLVAVVHDLLPSAYIGLASSSNLVVWTLQAFAITLLPLVMVFLVLDVMIERNPRLAPYIFGSLWMIAPIIAPIHIVMSIGLALGAGSFFFAIHRMQAESIIARRAGEKA